MCGCERETVCVWVDMGETETVCGCERETVYVWVDMGETERLCVGVRERLCVWVDMGETERLCVGVRERLCVCGCERETVCGWVGVCIQYVHVCLCGNCTSLCFVFRQAHGGVIINITATLHIRGTSLQAHVGVAKAAIGEIPYLSHSMHA